MSELYDSIPQNRKDAYLENAEGAIRQATDPVVEALGRTVVSDAEDIVAGEETEFGPAYQAQVIARADADAPRLADAVETYVHDNDSLVDEGFSSGVAEEAD